MNIQFFFAKMPTAYSNVRFSCTYAKIYLRDRENDSLDMLYVKFMIKRLRKRTVIVLLVLTRKLTLLTHELLLWGLVAEMQGKSYIVHMEYCQTTTCKRK